MSNDYEECRQNLIALSEWYESNASRRNEATTRLQLVDRIFFECLGWDRADVTLEELHDGRYTDYTFRLERRLLIVEAKREGKYLDFPAGRARAIYSIRGLRQDVKHVAKALDQVMSYAQSRGVPFASVINGHHKSSQ